MFYTNIFQRFKGLNRVKWNNYLFYIIVSRLYNAAFNVIMYNNEE